MWMGLSVMVLWLAGAQMVRAEGDTLYGSLIMATVNEDEARRAPVPPELRSQAEALEAVFGYNEFRILAQKRQPLTTATEDWMVRGRGFSLKVDTKYPKMNGYALGLELLKEQQVLVEAEVQISRERPCFIRGPFVGRGQVIILLMVE